MSGQLQAVSSVPAGKPPAGGAASVDAVATLYAQLEHALLAAMAGDAVARLDAIGAAEAVVHRLIVRLDLREGGELARRLAGLYEYFVGELRELRRAADQDRLDELLELAVTLKAAAAGGRVAA